MTSVLRRSWHVVLLLLLSLSVHAEAAEPQRVFKAGAYAIDITPEKFPTDSAGNMTPRKADAAHDPLHARCLVLDDGQTTLALVTCDSCMIPREIFDAAKEKAAEATGIPAIHILCSATHTHTAVTVTPVFQSEVETEYCRFLEKKIAEGIIAAHARREPARIGWAVGANPRQVFNRRWFLRPGSPLEDPFDRGTDKVRMNPRPNDKSLVKPAGPTDPEVPVLAVQTLQGEPLALWANYSLHYVGGVPGNSLSADYFGEFARQIAQSLKADKSFVAAMTNGTSGDINNVNFFEGAVRQQPFEQIRLVAADVARSALVAYERVEYQDWVPLRMLEREIELGVRKPDQEEIARAKELIAAAGPGPWPERRLVYANETLDMAQYPDTVKARLQAIRIGDLGIVSTPCETFVETGLAIKKQSPLKPTFTIELANGYNGYLPTPEQHALGGYETWRAKSSYLAEDAEPKVRETLLAMLDELAKEDKEESSNDNQTSQRQIPGALESIESTRGGRHWVDAATDPPKTAEESLACLQVEPGLKVELVAAEPLVRDPVSIAFDQEGRMFVVEYGDYPIGPEKPGEPPLSRLVMLEDGDGDGRMDRRHVFADRLNFAHSLMPYFGGLLVGAQTEVLFLKDTDGDHQADVREVLFSGFTPAHPQMQIGNPRWGMDNWIYLNYGPGLISRGSYNPADPSHPLPSVAKLEMPRKEFRFHPLTMEFGPAAGLGQFGNTIDNFGRRFFCTNRNPIITAPIPYEVLRRNPFVIASRDQYDVGPAGGDTRVYPLVEMKSNYLSHAGTHTSACGVTAYQGDLLGAKFADSVFVCEPIGHLVTRSIIEPTGATLTAERARPKADFLASTDTWFRPASLATGPDGALYVADMYRLWVEHPKFLPEEIAARLDWRAGEDRGRLWRVVPEKKSIAPKRFQPPQTLDDLVELHNDTNGWRRQLAQRLLVERQSADAAPELRSLLQSGTSPRGRQHALGTLAGLNALTSADIEMAAADKDVYVRQDAVSLATRVVTEQDRLLNLLAETAGDKDARVRFVTALALGEVPCAQATELLTALALRDGGEMWFATAILTSTKECSGQVLAGLVRDSSVGATYINLVRDLASVVGARGDVAELALLLGTIGQNEETGVWWQTAALSGLATGLARHQGPLGRTTLARLLNEPPAELDSAAAPVRELLERTASVTLDSQHAVSDRVAAIELLGYQPFGQAAKVYEQLLAATQPVEVQMAAIESMQKSGSEDAAAIVFARWPQLGPRVRPAALNLLLRRASTTLQALEAMAAGQINPAVIDIDQRVRLLRHADPAVLKLAQSLFGGAVSANRRAVAEQYAAALSLKSSIAAGAKVFDRICAKCHRIDGRGFEVGPDISDVRNRSREALLYDILDPNQKLEPRFTDYLVITDDGRIFNGLMVSETAEAVVLRQPEGKEVTIPRGEIEQIGASGKSLMPEGVEKEISVQQMADLLEYLKGR